MLFNWQNLRYLTWIIVGKLYAISTSFLLSIILTRSFSVEQYGLYQTSLLVISAVLLGYLPSLPNVCLKYVALNKLEIFFRLRQYRVSWRIWGYSGLGIAVLYFLYVNNTDLMLFCGFCMFAFPYFYDDLYKQLLQGKEEFIKLVKIQTGLSTLILLICFTMVKLDASPNLLAIAFVSTSAIYNFFISRYILRDYSVEGESNISIEFEEARNYSVKLSLINILTYSLEFIDKMLVSAILGPKALAIYTVGVLIPRRAKLLLKEALQIILPKIAREGVSIIQVVVIFITGTILGSVLALVMPKLILFFYGSSYKESILLAQIILFTVGLYLATTIIRYHFLLNKDADPRITYIVNILSPVVQITLMSIVLLVEASVNQKLFYLVLIYACRDLVTSMIILIVHKILKKPMHHKPEI